MSSVSFAWNAISVPSRDHAGSTHKPEIVDVRLTGVPPARATTQMSPLEMDVTAIRVPSGDQMIEEVCETKSVDESSRELLPLASITHSRHVPPPEQREKAILVPSGENTGCRSCAAFCVTLSGRPPVALTVKISSLPAR